MAEHPLITLTFTNNHPGRFPGERGLQTKTILEFTDSDGDLLAMARELKSLQALRHGMPLRFLAANAFHRAILSVVWSYRTRREKRLNTKVRHLTLKMLRGNVKKLQLRMAANTTSSGFNLVEHEHQAHDIATRLEYSTEQWLWVVEPS